MQSIYIDNIYKKNNFEILKNYLNHNKEIKTEDYFFNFFYSADKSSLFKKNNDFISNLGVFVYKNFHNKKAIELFYHDLKSGLSLKNLLKSSNTRGQFVLILYYNNELMICTDRLGYYPLYIYQKADEISISNSMLAIAKNNKCSINNIGVSQYLSENYKYAAFACCDQNIFNEIKYFEAGTIFTLCKSQIKKEKYFDIKNEIKISNFQNFDFVLENAENLLTENLSFLKNIKGKIHSDITGGVDTRVIIALLSKLNINFNVGLQGITEYNDASNSGKFSEIEIVKKIIEYKQLNFSLYSDENYFNKKKLIDDITFLHSHKQTYNRRTGYFLDVKDSNADIIISGLSGTELLRSSYYDYFKKNDKLNLDTFLPEYVEQVDIMHDNLINKKEYYDHLKQFYEDNLNGVNRKTDKDLSSYIDYFAFYRTHFCRYLSLANSIMPFYTPYGDFPFAQFMYQVSYDLKSKFKIQRHILHKIDKKLASFYSTRGFPLTKVNFRNFYKFTRMIDTNIPQQYFSVAQKINQIFSKKVINYLFRNKSIYKKYFYKNKNSSEQKKNLWNIPNDFGIINDLEEILSKNLPVYEIVDKNKFKKYVENDCNHNVFNRVFNLNRILEYTNY